MRLSWTCMAILAVGGLAAADEVVLKNGHTLEGIVTETEDRVTVEFANGSVTLPKGQVKEIVRDTEVIREFDERRRSATTADAHYQLGQWAAERGMKERAEAQYQRVIAMDPDHTGARQQLGFVQHDGRWLTEEQYMALKGFVEYEGRWMPWDLFEKLRNQELQARRERERQQERVYVLESMLEDEGRAGLPRVDVAEPYDRVFAPTRTAPWNWGVRRNR